MSEIGEAGSNDSDVEVRSLRLEFSSASMQFDPHEQRQFVLEEVHARPFRPIVTPARILHFAFLTAPKEAQADRAAFTALCNKFGTPGPGPIAHHHGVKLDHGILRWEQHTEFTSYSWRTSVGHGSKEGGAVTEFAEIIGRIPQPGRHLASIEVLVATPEEAPDLEAIFLQESLCAMSAENGQAVIATDFRAAANGFVKILVIDRGLPPMRIGALVQRLLELETYRVLALLGLPEAYRLAPSVRRIEEQLVELTRQMTVVTTLEANQQLLDRLAKLAADLEAGAAESLYRFGATRAYQSIVQGRLTAIGFEPIEEHQTFSAFLNRRMAPALRTCASIEERQINLSRKLARATQLLRAKVDVGMEAQNREILSTLSERAQMQLRLQQTVEGLSIAAISYYVIGLLGHAVGAAPHLGVSIDAHLVMALAIPIVLGAVAILVRCRLRRHQPAETVARGGAHN
ncbi:DUF3422 family protein [Mesorhizobium sp.]|uniref:DUF3422 family protein n=1 Tax=Mesorhizobium sp. TaxID=1871066 RepID=UPI00257F7D9E|nr:DUF3422 domain-containing protein [Mesorhizobium sp.]